MYTNIHTITIFVNKGFTYFLISKGYIERLENYFVEAMYALI